MAPAVKVDREDKKPPIAKVEPSPEQQPAAKPRRDTEQRHAKPPRREAKSPRHSRAYRVARGDDAQVLRARKAWLRALAHKYGYSDW